MVLSVTVSAFSKLFRRKPTEVEHLTRLVRRYCVEQQQVPKNLLDLVSLRYLDSLPVAPRVQKYVLDRQRAEVRLE